MSTVIRDLGSFTLCLGGGVLLGIAYLQPDWNTGLHATAFGVTFAGVALAKPMRRTLAVSVAMIMSALSGAGTLLQGGQASMPSILLIIGSAGIGAFLWLGERPGPEESIKVVGGD
jgi:hypothetical protein